MGETDDRQGPEDSFREVASRLAEARVMYAQEWQWARAKANSDMQATQMAIERTKDVLTIAYAEYELAKWRLTNGD